jgi:hypothetical protein
MLISIVSTSAYSFIFEKDNKADLRVSCFDVASSPCDAGTFCNLTAFYPNSSLLVDNQRMTRTEMYYNFTLDNSQTFVTGEYSAVVSCNGTTNDYTSFTYLISPNGLDPDKTNSGFYIGLMAVLIIIEGFLIWGVFKVKNEIAKWFLINFGYAFLVAITYVGWSMATDFLTSAPFISSMLKIIFYILMILLFPLILCSIIWLIYRTIMIKEIKQMMESGVPEDEAFERMRKGKHRW